MKLLSSVSPIPFRGDKATSSPIHIRVFASATTSTG
jgi:hypothetical protein